jgi:septum site-determining protein MinC
MAFILRVEMPLDGWITRVDEQIARSPSFFAGRPVILDLGDLPADEPMVPELVQALRERGVRILDIEGYPGEVPGVERWGFAGGRTGDLMAIPDDKAAPPPETAIVIEHPVRSGQVVSFPGGDVTVVGHVASGAEIMAGGSIHVYGPLRGRAVAGALGNPKAQIFCQRLEAELVAIDGFYRTAEDIEPAFRGKPARVWLEDGGIKIAPLG